MDPLFDRIGTVKEVKESKEAERVIRMVKVELPTGENKYCWDKVHFESATLTIGDSVRVVVLLIPALTPKEINELDVDAPKFPLDASIHDSRIAQ